MFHLTVAIARFFEFLLLDIVKSVAGVAAIALIALVLCAAAIAGIFRLGRTVNRRRK